MPIGLGYPLGRGLRERGVLRVPGRDPGEPPAMLMDRAVEIAPPDPGTGGLFHEEWWLPPGVPRSEMPEITPRIVYDPERLSRLFQLLAERRR